MSQPDWSKFSLKIYINAPIQSVFDTWTSREGLEDWFLRKAEFKSADGTLRGSADRLQVGDTYEWMWYGHPDTAVEHGVVTENNGCDRF